MDKKLIKQLISDNIINKNDRILIGVSGGADSVCLLHLLASNAQYLGITVFAAHINHSLRLEADSEEEFVIKLCEKLGVDCFTKKADINAIAAEQGICTEQAGRQVRYDFFNELCNTHKLNKIATAHHMNDNAETILMHFIRGAGIRGLSGIPQSYSNIIRPLLGVTRHETEEYCIRHNLEFCTDKTNFDTHYTRNRIRLVTIPEIEKNYNPSFVRTLTTAASSISDDCDYIENAADTAYGRIIKNNSIYIPDLLKEHRAIARRVIMKYISSACKTQTDIYASYTDSIYSLATSGITGKTVSLPDSFEARCEYDKLIISKKNNNSDYEYKLTPDTVTEIPEAGISVEISSTLSADKDCFEIPVGADIIIRNRRTGDRFLPVGMNGSKKLKDYFIDIKLPRHERERHPLLTINGDIAWVIGFRRDRRFEAQSNFLKITVKSI